MKWGRVGGWPPTQTSTLDKLKLKFFLFPFLCSPSIYLSNPFWQIKSVGIVKVRNVFKLTKILVRSVNNDC